MCSLAEFGSHLNPQSGVQVGQGLVEEEGLRFPNDGATYGHPLALSAGQFLRLSVQQVCNSQDVRHLPHPGVDFRLRISSQFQPEGHVFVDGHMGVQGVVLEDHRDVPVFGREVVRQASVNVDFPPGHVLQAGNQSEGGRFSASRRPDQHDELPIVNVEAEVLYRYGVPVVDLPDVFQGYGCHPAPSSR